jgi:biotin operon repressor
MLFRGRILEGIRNGAITTAYRRASRPPARVGRTQRVDADGVVEFTSVELIDESTLNAHNAAAAGYETLAALKRSLPDRRLTARPYHTTGDVYRVRFRYVASPDPRLTLRRSTVMNGSEAESIISRLERWDRASRTGPWTRATLNVIAANPRLVSTKLAEIVGMERLAFKANVRKLKALGLTISHEVGYELSPRGRVLLRHLEEPGI